MNVCAIACQSATMLVLCSNVTVSVKKFTSVRLEWSLDQLGRHINIVIIIIIIIRWNLFWSKLRKEEMPIQVETHLCPALEGQCIKPQAVMDELVVIALKNNGWCCQINPRSHSNFNRQGFSSRQSIGEICYQRERTWTQECPCSLLDLVFFDILQPIY